jgi:glycosyltransferase involved in cell wall biosynthesis
MHILYIHQYFATLQGNTGTRSYEFARRWVAAGHQVTMLTSTTNLTHKDLSNAKGKFLKRVKIDGIDVLVWDVLYEQQMGMIRRCWAFLLFLLLSSTTVLFIKRVDVVYATSTPLTVGAPALAAKWLKGKRFVFEVRDQWPNSIIQLGLLRSRFLIGILLWFERTIYENSAAIITLSDGMADDIRKVMKKSKPVHVVTNGADLDLFQPGIDGSAVRREYGWDNKLVLLQAGAMGMVNGLEFVIKVAEKLKNREDILFVLVGKGKSKKALQSTARELGLNNVEFLPSMSKQQLVEVFAAADIAMVVMANYAIFERVAALNKFYDSLSAGKPVLLNYSGWQRVIVEEYNAGFGCKLWNVDEFVEKVLYFNSHREVLIEMGKNSRRLGEERFDREKLATQALRVVEVASGEMRPLES